jgi:hypothetical protein
MTHFGFDTDIFPGVPLMGQIKASTNLEFVGFYLAPAPSHGDASWMAHRGDLAAQGWGFLPVYVGQETVGPGRHNVCGPQGTIDGAEAVTLMRSAGFPAGSYVYLDLENGPPFTAAEAQYVEAWVKLVEGGGYKAGIYGSHLYAAELAALAPSARIWTVRTATVDRHQVPGRIFTGRDPADSGFPGAFACQFDQSAVLTAFGLEVDLDSALSADPSV